MEGALFGAILAFALLFGAYWGSGFIFSLWAKSDKFFTEVKEGTGKVIVKGQTFHHIVLSYKGYHLNDPGKTWFDKSKPEWEILPNKRGKNYNDRPHLFRQFGLFWVGIPGMRSVYKYHFVWNEYRSVAGSKQEVWHRDTMTSIFKANSFTYVMVIDGAKTKDNATVRAEFTVIIRITNPYLALFAADDWRALVESYVDRQGKNFIGTFTYDELRSETDQNQNMSEEERQLAEEKKEKTKRCERENFSKPVVRLTIELPEETECDAHATPIGLKGKYGVVIEAANMAEITLSGALALRNEEISTTLFLADAQALATQKAADADAYSVRTAGDANAYKTTVEGRAEAEATEVMLTTLAKHPELAAIKLATDALAQPGDGKTIVIPSDIGKVVEGVFGRRK